MFTPETTLELQIAVNAWGKNKKDALEKYGHISEWNTSKITNMRELFSGKISFSEDLSKWDVSNVTDMSYMFDTMFEFNCDLSFRTYRVSQICVICFLTYQNSRVIYHYGMYQMSRI